MQVGLKTLPQKKLINFDYYEKFIDTSSDMQYFFNAEFLQRA